MRKIRLKPIYFFIILSIGIHCLVLNYSKPLIDFNIVKENESHQFKIKDIRIVGEEDGAKKKYTYLKQKLRKTSLSDLSYNEPITRPSNTQIERKNHTFKSLKPNFNNGKVVKSLSLKNDRIKDFLKTPSPSQLTPEQALKVFDNTNIDISLEVPKGIKEDELNKNELVFYSFQKRTAMAYINSFYKELISFENKNPQLRFPLTSEKKQLAGRIIYDKNGDILMIKSLAWTRIKKLDDFFQEVLSNMSSLPNPPNEILENEQFAVNFILTLN